MIVLEYLEQVLIFRRLESAPKPGFLCNPSLGSSPEIGFYLKIQESKRVMTIRDLKRELESQN